MTSICTDLELLEEIWSLDSYAPGSLADVSWIGPAPASRQWHSPSALDTAASMPETSVLQEPVHWLRPPEWHEEAACKGMKTKEFFGDDQSGKQPSLHPSVLKRTRTICLGQCLVARECLLWALERGEDYGIWGGTSGRQRKAMNDLIDMQDPADQQVFRYELVDRWLTQ